MSRPAGMSDDEADSEDEYFTYNSVKHVPQVKTVISRDINEEFYKAVYNRDIELIKSLLKEGANINYKSITGWFPILQAASDGCYEVLKLLIENGADVNCSHEKNTPLLMVCASNSKDETTLLKCLDILLSHGVDANVTDWFRIPAISRAVKLNHEKIVLRLISAKCDINKLDQDGWSPIFYAVESGNINMVGILKDAGADLCLLDKRGRTLLEIAASKDFKDIIELISGCKDFSDENDHFERSNSKMSNYQFIMSEFPNFSDRFSGYPSDALHIIDGIGLNCLNRLFCENNIHLGHLLTITDERLSEIGVRFWYDRKKILYSIKQFYEYPWNTSCFGSPVLEKNLDPFQVAQVLVTITRQLYVLSISIYWWKKNCDSKSQEVESLKALLKNIRDCKRVLKIMQEDSILMDKENNPIPCDLILSEPHEKSNKRWKFIISLTIGAFVIYKCKKIF